MSTEAYKGVLNDYAFYVKEHIAVSSLDEDHYFSTENMLPNRGGVCRVTSLPEQEKAVRVEAGDVLISNIRPYFKKIWLARELAGCSNDVLCIRAKSTCLPEFLFYYLSSDTFFDYVMAGAKGTKMPRGDKQQILHFHMLIPSLDIQKQVISILSCIDKKIQLNAQINRNLEQQAKAIFRSWFVDFEPFQDGKFVDSEMGPIPAGWRVVSLEDIALYNSEKLPASQAKHDTYVSTENMLPNQGGIELASSVPSTGCVTVFAKNDVLLSNIRPYFRKIWYASSSGTCSTDVLCFRTKAEVKSEYLFCVLNNEKFFEYIMSGAKGTKMPRGDKRQMMSYRIVMPPQGILENFAETLKPLVEHQRRNTMESRRLATLRDTLLPRLMSGEIDVSEVEV